MSTKSCKALIVLLCVIFISALCPAAFAADEAPAAVTVLFYTDDESALPGLTVSDGRGVTYEPAADADSGEIQYGQYLLLPGEYSYFFHDGAGRYEDTAGSFTVGQALMHIIPLELTQVIEIQSFALTEINPLYIDVITEADIPESAISDEEAQGRLLSLVRRESGSRRKAAFYGNSGTVYTSYEAAGSDLKQQLMNRETTAVINIRVSGQIDTREKFSAVVSAVFSAAITHTGVPVEGDYIRYEYGGYEAGGQLSYSSSANTTTCVITYTPVYYTTSAQEAQLNDVVESILSGLNLAGKSDYQKIRAIYDYLCANVAYDYTNLNNESYKLKYTAYDALIRHTAVCQGYSVAFYRLCLASEVDTRMITSSAMKHAWNIVELGGVYYELDTTWDAGRAPANYSYFLRGSNYWIANHKNSGGSTIGDEYNNGSFAAAYPLPSYDAPTPITVTFNSNGGSAVAAQLLMSGDILIRPDAPVKGAYWFAGWYADSGCKTRFDFDRAVTASVTLYAKWAAPDLTLPAALTEIGDEAFTGGAFTFVRLPEQTVSIGARAFAACPKLAYIYIPGRTTSIAPDAFEGAAGLTVFGAAGSAAETYASAHGYAFIAVTAVP